MKPNTSTLKALLVLAGAATLLAACTADPGYDPSQFAYGYPLDAAPAYDYPAFGAFDWHRRWDHDRWHGGRR